jgi:hypothetical protein
LSASANCPQEIGSRGFGQLTRACQPVHIRMRRRCRPVRRFRCRPPFCRNRRRRFDSPRAWNYRLCRILAEQSVLKRAGLADLGVMKLAVLEGLGVLERTLVAVGDRTLVADQLRVWDCRANVQLLDRARVRQCG